MPAFPGFIGPTGRVRSLNVNAERTVNLYLEVEPGTPKVPVGLYGTPGVRPFTVLDNGPVRAIFHQDGRCFAVGGSSFYEVFANGTNINRGTATADGRPATISSNGPNGGQLFITSGGIGYIYDLETNIGAPVTTNSEPVQMGCFVDGYFFALKANSNQFSYSALFDGTSWDALDVNQISTATDQIVTMIPKDRDLWLIGSQTTSVWHDSGDADNPYQPIPGVLVANGSAAAFGAAVIDNSVFWLGSNDHGNRVVYRNNGYTPVRVSSHAVEFALNNYPRVSDAIAWAYQDEGHAFYCLYLPATPVPRSGVDHTIWVYDITSGQWHERATWDPTFEIWRPFFARCHTSAFERQLIGDRSSGTIFDMDLDFYDYELPVNYPTLGGLEA